MACSVLFSNGVTALAATAPTDSIEDQISPLATIPDKYILDGWIWNLDCNQKLTYDLHDIWKAPDNGDYWLVYQVELQEPITQGETFDVDAYLWFTQANPWQEWRVAFIDSAWTTSIYWNSTNTNHQSHLSRVQKSYTASTHTYNYSYKITDVTATTSIKYIWIMQKVSAYKGQEMQHTFNDFSVTIETNSGKLASIIEYIKNLPTNIKNALKSLFDGITNAITNAVSSILEGIKNLFVPTQEDLTEYKDKWDQLLADRFGAVYQCVSLVQSYWESMRPGMAIGSIPFPMIALEFSGVYWEFGGFDVQIRPPGFDYLFQVLSMIVNAVCSIAFLNVLKNKYERLMDG